MFLTCVRDTEYRSIYAQMISDDLVVYGEAGISLDVHGLEERRRECFLNIATFAQGLAPEQMYSNALLFLAGDADEVVVPKHLMKSKANALLQEGFQPRIGMNFEL